MNKTLALYFDEKALFGAIKPFEEKFVSFPPDCSPTYAFGFFLDGHTVRYGQQYQEEAEAVDKRIIQNFWVLLAEEQKTFQILSGYHRPVVELLEPIVSDLLKSYRAHLEAYLDQDQIDSLTEGIPAVVSFSEAIPHSCRQKVITYLLGRSIQLTLPHVLPAAEHLLLHLSKESSTRPGKTGSAHQPGEYAVIKAFHNDVQVALVTLGGGGAVHQVHHDTLAGYGADPREGVLAEIAVEAANKQLHVLPDQASKDQEYLHLLPQARLWNKQLSQSNRPFVDFSCALSVAPTNVVPFTIDRREVDRLTQDRSQHLFRLIHTIFSRWTSVDGIVSWMLLGDHLQNRELLDGLYQLGRNRIQLVGTQEAIRLTLEGMLAGKEKAEQPGAPRRVPTNFVVVDKLKAGDQVEFLWPPDRFVAAAYIAHGQFRIVAHRNSKIVAGDTFFTDYLKVGEAAVLKQIVRQNKLLGDYKSAVLQELYIKN